MYPAHNLPCGNHVSAKMKSGFDNPVEYQCLRPLVFMKPFAAFSTSFVPGFL